MFLKPKLKIMSSDNCELVHEKTLKVLAETGVRFESDQALDVLKRHGVKISDNTAYFTPSMVDRTIAQIPRKFKWIGRNRSQDLMVGDDLVVLPNVGNIYVQDLTYGRREGKKKDFSNIIKLQQASPSMNVCGGSPVDISDIENNKKFAIMLFEAIKHSDKPILSLCQEGIHNNQRSLQILKISLGKNQFRDEIYTSVIVDPLSPLTYDKAASDTIIAYAKEGQAILLVTCSMAGVTGPITLSGMLVAQNAEILAGLILTQLIHPGCPVVCGVSSSIANLKQIAYLTAAPDMNIMTMAGTDLYEDFYHLPTLLIAGQTESKMLDYQAGFETMQTLLLPILSGVKMIQEGNGTLDSFMTTSLEKMIIDEELIERSKHIARGLSLDSSMFLLDAIHEVGSRESFLCHESTLVHYKELWRSMISEDRPYSFWERDGKLEVTYKAHKVWKDRLSDAPQSMISESLEKELLAVIEKI